MSEDDHITTVIKPLGECPACDETQGYLRTNSGKLLSSAYIKAMTDEAERGYDIDRPGGCA